MNIYPALCAKMGTWTYYVIKMSARELSENVKYAKEIEEDLTLSDAIQRILNEGRVNKEIVQYLKRQDDRFFSSIVIAALDGDPKFYPVEITDDPRFEMISDDRRLNESFGVLKFDGTQTYYALDGQHRLASIRTLLDRDNELSDGCPENFANDEFSVILVMPRRDDSGEIFKQKYRRLFSNLNRYARPTDHATNIIMDEDDAFAIITRKLISDHEFFSYEGRQRDSIKIKTKKGKNLRSSDSFFTQIEVLYTMNIILLSSNYRKNNGWGLGSPSNNEKDIKKFILFRPDEDFIDQLYDELVVYWNAILYEIADLRKNPPQMRNHSIVPGEEDENESSDHLLFWPIGQEMLANIVRDVLNGKLPQNPGIPQPDDVKNALKGLSSLEWRLHYAPWKYFMLIADSRGGWRMRNEERHEVVRIGRQIQRWLVGIDPLDEEGIANLKESWKSRLIPAQEDEEVDNMWKEVENIRNRI